MVIACLLICIIIGSLTACAITGRKKNRTKSAANPLNQNSLIGKKTPDFNFIDSDNNPTTLYAFTGTKRAIIFYPKDGSPFCTQQLCSIRDNKALLEQNNIMAIGISPDSQKNHDKFKEAKNLPFTLVSDPDKKIAQLYHITTGWLGLQRVTVLIDENNIVTHVIDNVKVTDHAQQIIDGFKAK